MNDHLSHQADWLSMLLDNVSLYTHDLRMGVFGGAKKVLRMSEVDGDIPQPIIQVGRKGNLILRWKFTHDREFILDFMNYLEFRYRYIGFGSDTGTVIVSKDYGENIRKAFRIAFGSNGVGFTRMMTALEGMKVE